jgi:hypothetical protein
MGRTVISLMPAVLISIGPPLGPTPGNQYETTSLLAAKFGSTAFLGTAHQHLAGSCTGNRGRCRGRNAPLDIIPPLPVQLPQAPAISHGAASGSDRWDQG